MTGEHQGTRSPSEVGPAGLRPTVAGRWGAMGGGGYYWKRKQHCKGDFILKAMGTS